MTGILLGDVPRLNAARLGPDRWALHYDGARIGWGKLARNVLRRAHALRAAGVAQGDRVLLALPNGIDLHELVFATWKLGATPMPVSSRMPIAELRAIAELGEPRLAITADAVIAQALGARPAQFGADHPEAADFATLEAPSWKVMTSGGSTGRPKLIVDALPSRMQSYPGMLRVPVDGVIAVAGPLYHNMPFATAHTAMLSGSSVAGMARFDAEGLLALLAQTHAQWVTLVPTMMQRIARLPEPIRASYDLSNLETVWHTAAPINEALKQFWIDWLGPERIWEIYGGTEGFATTQLSGTEWLAHRGSVGRPVGAEVLILGEDGAALPPGEVGEIYMRRAGAGGTPSYAYVGAQSRRLPDDFESFGDQGWLDAEGYLYIADRRTDLILSGGHNVYPAEVERALLDHPHVSEAVVIGLPDADMGARVHAIVRWEEGHKGSEDDLNAHLADRLVGWKRPRSFEFTQALLRDEAGKVRRSRLREERL